MSSPRITLWLKELKAFMSRPRSFASLKYLSWTVAGLSLLSVITLIPFIIRAPLIGDQIEFFAVGHGILNGLQPWKDLFETKPPIVFWLSAFSLLFGSNTLYVLIIMAGVMGMIALMVYAARDTQGKALAVILTCALALFLLIRGFNEAEILSALPSTIGILAFVRKGKWEFVSAVCFTILVLLKEPFIITYCLALLLLVKTRRDFNSIVRVVLCGVIFQLMILFLTGNLFNYLNIYLPEMLHGRVSHLASYHDYATNLVTTIDAPTLIQALRMRVFFGEFVAQGGLALGIMMATGLLALFYILRSSVRHGLIGIAIFASSILFMDRLSTMEQVLTILKWNIPFQNTFFLWKVFELAGIMIMMIALALWLYRKNRMVLWRSIAISIAFYGFSVSNAIGGSLDQYLQFIVPIFLALTYVFVSAPRDGLRHTVALTLTVLLGISMIPMRLSAKTLIIDPEILAMQPILQARVKLIDGLMDSCGYKQYLLAGETFREQADGYFIGMTNHSPYQIPYGNYRAEDQLAAHSILPANPYLHDALLAHIKDAKFAVGITDDLPYGDFYPSFLDEFTQTPPPCAEEILKQHKVRSLKLYFRKSSSSPDVTKAR